MPLLPAHIAEMMRSDQKDSEFITTSLIPSIQHVMNHIRQLIGAFPAGFNNLHVLLTSWPEYMGLTADFVYFLLTTLLGHQTVGEEYVNIVQIGRSRKHHPKCMLRTVMTVAHCFGPLVVIKVVERLKSQVEAAAWIVDSKRVALVQILDKTANLLQWFYTTQRSLFFLGLSGENIAKWITGISYVSIRKSPVSEYKAFTVLGYLGLLRSIHSLAFGMKFLLNRLTKPSVQSKVLEASYDFSKPTTSVCPLCQNEFQDISCTPCGHLFCWNCVYTWCLSNPICPICRESSPPKRITHLVNFTI